MTRATAVALALVLLGIAGCIRIIVNIGGRDVEHKQVIEVEPSIGSNSEKKGNPGDPP